MSIVEASISVPAEHETNVFGQFDQHIKKMERALNITVVNRDGVLKIIGGETAVNKARKIFEQLIELSKHGNIIRNRMFTMLSHFLMRIKKKHFLRSTRIRSAIRSTESRLNQRRLDRSSMLMQSAKR